MDSPGGADSRDPDSAPARKPDRASAGEPNAADGGKGRTWPLTLHLGCIVSPFGMMILFVGVYANSSVRSIAGVVVGLVVMAVGAALIVAGTTSREGKE